MPGNKAAARAQVERASKALDNLSTTVTRLQTKLNETHDKINELHHKAERLHSDIGSLKHKAHNHPVTPPTALHQQAAKQRTGVRPARFPRAGMERKAK